jgi:hypothetical protein
MQLHVVGPVQASPTRGVAVITPRYIGKIDKEAMAATMAPESSSTSTYLTAAAATAAVVAAVAQLRS